MVAYPKTWQKRSWVNYQKNTLPQISSTGYVTISLELNTEINCWDLKRINKKLDEHLANVFTITLLSNLSIITTNQYKP